MSTIRPKPCLDFENKLTNQSGGEQQRGANFSITNGAGSILVPLLVQLSGEYLLRCIQGFQDVFHSAGYPVVNIIITVTITITITTSGSDT